MKEGNTYRLIGETIFEKFRVEDFADLYSEEGRPAISPVILAFVSVFQYSEKLPDRQAAESLRMRIDWKYALHLPLDYGGFDFSVLSEFRDRLLEHEAEDRVFEKLVKEFQAMGWSKHVGNREVTALRC